MHSQVQVGCLEECGTRAVVPSVQASVYKSLVDVATGMQYLHNLGIVHGVPSSLIAYYPSTVWSCPATPC